MPPPGFQGLEKALRDGYRIEVLREVVQCDIEARLYKPRSMVSRLWDQIKWCYQELPLYASMKDGLSSVREAYEERQRSEREYRSIVIGISPTSVPAALEACSIVYARDGKESRRYLDPGGRIYGDRGAVDMLSVLIKGRGALTGSFARGLFHLEMGNCSNPNYCRFKPIAPAGVSADTFSKAYIDLNGVYMSRLPKGFGEEGIERLMRLVSDRVYGMDGEWPAEIEQL